MIKDGFIHCPVCGRKTRTKVMPETKLEKFPLFCHFCKRVTVVDVVDGEIKTEGER